MGDLQSNSQIFSVRIVTIDYYMAQPIPSLDICHSSFQGGDVNEVPVIRVYGSTPGGQKTCLHLHRALPYLYVPCSDIPLTPGQEGNAYTNIMSSSLEKALKLKGNAGQKRQHVHGCTLVRAKRLYGYHSEEELFVKIYLYYPQDISRAANLLLSGTVLDKSLQPHESHIPFILQFMVDYNLYGMGHLHMSKVKFRHPIPCVFPCAKPNTHNQGMVAALVGQVHLDSPVWLSATTPSDWLWPNPEELDASLDQELHCPKRSSVCELEVDAIVDEILNRKYKSYSSLSQTHSEVKMVQSLIPIWEEEYERTGVHEAPAPPDPGKPLPEDVLKYLSHGLELGSKLRELCNEDENRPSSSIPEIALRETDIIGSLSPPILLSEVDGKSHIQGRVAGSQMLIKDDLQSTHILGMTDIKGTDKEALNLLKWLATSQSAEDIHSDDELTHEIILSPLLSSPTLDKVLEKANMEYDNESQKECQDILDSIDNLVPSESLKKPSGPSDLGHPEEAPPKPVIPQVDGSGDDIYPTPSSDSVSISSELELTSENKRSSRHYLLIDPGISILEDRGTALCAPLPFSASSKLNGVSEHATFTESNPSGGESRVSDSPSYLARNEMGSDVFSLEKDTVSSDCNSNEEGTLVKCSIRDLMRKKRCYRKDQECEILQNKRVSSERESKENKFKGTSSFEPQLTIDDQEIKQFKSCVTETFCQDTSLQNALPFTDKLAVKSNANIFQDGISHGRALRTEALIADRCNPEDTSNSKLQCLKVVESCEQTVIASSTATSFPLEKEVYGEDRKMSASCGRISSTQPNLETPFCNVLGINDASIMSVSHAKHDIIVQDGISKAFSGLKSSVSFLDNEEAKYMKSIGFTMCMKTPIADWIDARSDNDPPSLACHNSHRVLNKMNHDRCKKNPIADWIDARSDNDPSSLACHNTHTILKERNHDERPGKALDNLLPFFTLESQEEMEIEERCTMNNCSDFHQGNILGVSFHSQNDGSLLYPLTPRISPPPVNSVCRWLSYVDEGSSSNLFAFSMPSDFDEDLPVSDYKSHLGLDPEEFNVIKAEEKLPNNHMMESKLKSEQVEDVKAHSDGTQDNSQISGPVGKSRSTPLSQSGFRDPASVGRGQQLTILSIEVLAESRGDLLPDPRYDAINAVALCLQNDTDLFIDFVVLLRSSLEPSRWTFDGSLACKVNVFSDERHLLDQFINLVSSSDPDILMGWDVQGGSLGFLAERALHLGLDLLDSISRTPSENVPGNTETSEKSLLLRTDGDSSVRNCVVQDDVIIEDEWGRTHASGVHVRGRVVLNVWRLMRSEVKLNFYSIEAVSETVLRRKIPFIHHKVLNSWFQSGPGQARYRCIDYVIERAKLNLEIMNQLDMINRTSELARVFGIDFFSVLSRGSQYRVESMLLRLAHTQNYLAISPGNQQVASQPAMECLPLVMEPESGFYSDPVVVLDFQSLYPSMIIAYNLCFSTCLGKLVASKPNTLGVASFSQDPGVMQDLKYQLMFTPNGVMFVPSKVRKGVLPRLLEEILSTRIMVKQAMKKLTPSQQVLQRICNARQLALKLIANVTYGYTAAGFSGRMPCSELADSIVQCGRSTLEKAISFVNAHERWNAKVIYGDTDSMFVLLKGRMLKESFQIGNEIAAAITAMNPRPVALKMEKVYCPCFLLTKKRYVGYSYESPEQTVPVFDAKGIETVRRDTCGAVAKLMERSLRLFFEHQDIAKVKTYLERQWKKILSGRFSLQDFVFAKEVRLGTYSSRASSLPPAAIVAIKAMRTDPRAEPRYAERIAYVVIHGEPGARLVDLVVDPLELLDMDSPFRINDLYYINKQIIPALQRVFGLVCVDLNKWFLEMPRPARETIGKRPLFASNHPRTRIDYYYLSKHCVLCGGLVQASAHICDPCSQNEVAAATTLIGRTSKLEREMQHLVEICRHCGGGDWMPESGIKCISIACSVFYERRKVQKELQALSNVAANKGLYPRCMTEWF